MAQEFFDSQPGYYAAAPEEAEQTEGSEEMQRTGKIAEQEANGDEIKENAEGAGNAVMRSAALAVHIADGNFADGCAIPRGQRRDEAVKFAVERHLVEHLAAVGFERGTEVVNIYAAELGQQPVRHAGGDAAHPEIIDANLAPAADDVVTGGNLLEEYGNISGIVLQIAI